MTKKQNLLMVSLLITVGIFIYLTIHQYALKLGLSGDSICSVSATINCDAAALSSYSEIFGIPIAIFGGFFNLILLGFIACTGLGWTERSAYLKTTVRGMLLISAITSLVMAFVSIVFVKVICPFCAATYVFSFINLALGWNLYNDARGKAEISAYFGDYKSHLISLLLIPIFSWVTAGMIQDNYGLNELKKIVPEKVAQWRNGTEYNFDLSTGISNHVTSSKVVIVEFADFKCSHCRDASKVFDTFLKANPDVQMILKPFPLDGTCNSSDKMGKGDGSRCTLAGWALCAEKIAQKGWDVQKWIFSKQDELFDAKDLKPFLTQLNESFKIDTTALSACADSAETYEALKKFSEEGSRAQVSGTPTIYLNNKKLPYGNILEVLKTAVSEAKK